MKLATVACQSVTLPHSGLARAALFRLRPRELHEAEDEDTMHDGRWYTMQESPGQRLESLGTPPLKLSDAEEENLEEAAALFSLLGVQVQVLGSSLLARRTAAVAATGPRGQLAAVLIRLTSDTCVQPRPRTGIRVIGHLPGSPDLHGTGGYVRWTDLGRPVAVAAAVAQPDQFQSLVTELQSRNCLYNWEPPDVDL